SPKRYGDNDSGVKEDKPEAAGGQKGGAGATPFPTPGGSGAPPAQGSGAPPAVGSGAPPGGMPAGAPGGPGGERGGAGGAADAAQGPKMPGNGYFDRNRYLFVTDESRHLPFAITLTVDQSHLHEILVALANSPLRIQTTQVEFRRLHAGS